MHDIEQLKKDTKKAAEWTIEALEAIIDGLDKHSDAKVLIWDIERWNKDVLQGHKWLEDIRKNYAGEPGQPGMMDDRLAVRTKPPEPEGPQECTIPPPGWTCTREAGHEGPCAALPSKGHENYHHREMVLIIPSKPTTTGNERQG